LLRYPDYIIVVVVVVVVVVVDDYNLQSNFYVPDRNLPAPELMGLCLLLRWDRQSGQINKLRVMFLIHLIPMESAEKNLISHPTYENNVPYQSPY
jgi:hypothetical protein